MKKTFLLLLTCIGLGSCDPAMFSDIANTVLTNGNITSAEAGSGLKQALEIGIGYGSEKLSQKGGYFNSPYKILLPEEARKVTDKLKDIPGFSNVENVILQKLNDAAEDAATKAKPIFVDAIRGITFNDAMGILMGNDDAATRYLQGATSTQLSNAFQPVIVNSLNKFNAIEYWESLVTKYNALPFVKKMNPRLDEYVTNEALKGLFSMVEKEEFGIRRDINKRTNELLKKVFAKQDSNRNK